MARKSFYWRPQREEIAVLFLSIFRIWSRVSCDISTSPHVFPFFARRFVKWAYALRKKSEDLAFKNTHTTKTKGEGKEGVESELLAEIVIDIFSPRL